jgi:hypothetical protein
MKKHSKKQGTQHKSPLVQILIPLLGITIQIKIGSLLILLIQKESLQTLLS